MNSVIDFKLKVKKYFEDIAGLAATFAARIKDDAPDHSRQENDPNKKL